MDRKSNYCSCCSGKSKLTRCTCKSQLGDPAKFSGRSSPGRFTSSCSTRKDDSQQALLALALYSIANRSPAPSSFSEANRAEQPSSLKSACKPANEKSPPPTFSQLVDQKSGQPILSKSTYKPDNGGSHLPGSSNPAVKEPLEKPARSPCPVNEDRSVCGKRRVTEEIQPHGNGVKEGVNLKHNVEAFDELEMEDMARVTLELFEGAKLLLRLSESKLGDVDLENRQEHQGEEFHNPPTDKTSPSPSYAVCGKRGIGEEISARGHCVKKRGHLIDETEASDDDSLSESLEQFTMEQFENRKSLNTFRAMKLQSACDDMASTLHRMGINVDDIAKISS